MRNLAETETVLSKLMLLIEESQDMHDTLTRLLRSGTHLLQNCPPGSQELATGPMQIAEQRSAAFMQELEERRKLLNQSVIFYSEADIVSSLFSSSFTFLLLPNSNGKKLNKPKF